MSMSRLLLVEDNPGDALLIRKGFELANANVDIQVVSDGDQAIAYLAGDAPYNRGDHPLPAVILLDLKLPRRSGLEVLEWIRRQPQLRDIPVIVMTSSREAANVSRAYQLGAKSYIIKQSGLESLVEAACAILVVLRAATEIRAETAAGIRESADHPAV